MALTLEILPNFNFLSAVLTSENLLIRLTFCTHVIILQAVAVGFLDYFMNLEIGHQYNEVINKFY